MNVKPQAIIFDFGGVISRTLFETHKETENALKLPTGTLNWLGPFASGQDALWESMQADEITERDYWKIRTKEVSDLTGNNWSQMSDFVQAARGAHPELIIRPEFFLTINIAKTNNIRLAILSNELDLFYGADFREKLNFLMDFEVIVDASYTNILKPHPRAYELCLEALKLSAAECIFIDDQHRNIIGAQNIGFNTVHFNVLNPIDSFAEALNYFHLKSELMPC